MKKIFFFLTFLISLLIVNNSFADDVYYGHDGKLKKRTNWNDVIINDFLSMRYFDYWDYFFYINLADWWKLYKKSKNALPSEYWDMIINSSLQDYIITRDWLYIIYNVYPSRYMYRYELSTWISTLIKNTASLFFAVDWNNDDYVYYTHGSRIYHKNIFSAANQAGELKNSILSYSIYTTRDWLYIYYITPSGIYKKQTNDNQNWVVVLDKDVSITNILVDDEHKYLYYRDWDPSNIMKKDLSLPSSDYWDFFSTSWSLDFILSSWVKMKICEDYTSSIPSLINEQIYNWQNQVFTSSWMVITDDWTSNGKAYWFWLDKNNSSTGSFNQIQIQNLKNFDDVEFFSSWWLKQTWTGEIINTFIDWYMMLDNYFFANWLKTDPWIYIKTFNHFNKIELVSSQTYAYRLFKRETDWSFTLILKNCITNEVCDISHTTSPLWFNNHKEIFIVPFSTAGYIKFTDYRIDDIKIYSYSQEYLTYPVCYYDDWSIEVNWEEFTWEEWEEFVEEEIKQWEPKETSFCSALNFSDYIKNPICWVSSFNQYFSENISNTQYFQYFKKLIDFLKVNLKNEDIILNFYWFDENLSISPVPLHLKKDDLNLQNLLDIEPDYDSDTWKLFAWILFFLCFVVMEFFVFFLLFLIVFPHTFIFTQTINFIKKLFPEMLSLNLELKSSFIWYLALLPLVVLFLWLFNYFVFQYIIIIYDLYILTLNLIWFFIDIFYSISLNLPYGSFVSDFNIVNSYVTWFFVVIIFYLVITKWAKI